MQYRGRGNRKGQKGGERLVEGEGEELKRTAGAATHGRAVRGPKAKQIEGESAQWVSSGGEGFWRGRKTGRKERGRKRVASRGEGRRVGKRRDRGSGANGQPHEEGERRDVAGVVGSTQEAESEHSGRPSGRGRWPCLPPPRASAEEGGEGGGGAREGDRVGGEGNSGGDGSGGLVMRRSVGAHERVSTGRRPTARRNGRGERPNRRGSLWCGRAVQLGQEHGEGKMLKVEGRFELGEL